MALRRWTGNAQNISGVYTITITGTWAQGDTAVVTIGDAVLTVTVGASITVTDVATLIKEAINTGTLTDTTAATSIAGGAAKKRGEFSGLVATSSAGVVTLTGTPGIPYTIVASDTAAAGAATDATVTAADGKWFFSNANNWVGGVPISGDDIRYDSGNVSCRFGIDTLIQPLSLVATSDYKGHIGLREINQDNQSLPFYEYRDKALKFTDDVPTTTTTVRLGEGRGSGSSLIRLDFNDVSNYVITVYKSGAGLDQQPAVMIADDFSGATNELHLIDGHVGVAFFGDETARLKIINVAKTAQNGVLEIGSGCRVNDTDFNIGGGTVTVASDNLASTPTVTMTAGTLTLDRGALWDDVYAWGGTLILGEITIVSNFEVGSATVECDKDPRDKVFTPKVKFHKGAKFNDTNQASTFSGDWMTQGCTLNEVDLNFGYSRTYSVA